MFTIIAILYIGDQPQILNIPGFQTMAAALAAGNAIKSDGRLNPTVYGIDMSTGAIAKI